MTIAENIIANMKKDSFSSAMTIALPILNFCDNKAIRGFPTILLLPIITTCLFSTLIS